MDSRIGEAISIYFAHKLSVNFFGYELTALAQNLLLNFHTSKNQLKLNKGKENNFRRTSRERWSVINWRRNSLNQWQNYFLVFKIGCLKNHAERCNWSHRVKNL